MTSLNYIKQMVESFEEHDADKMDALAFEWLNRYELLNETGQPFRLSFPAEITEDSIALFLKDLEAKGLLYHIDDDPREVYRTRDERTFSDAEAYALIGFWSVASDKFTWEQIWNLFPDITL